MKDIYKLALMDMACQWFEYDETSPSGLRWKKTVIDRLGREIKIKKNMPAGSLNKSSGYWEVRLNKKNYRVHRLILIMHDIDLAKEDYVDHIDGDRSNNLIHNLRVVNPKLNSRNQKKPDWNTSGYVGVGRYDNGRGVTVYKAVWFDLDGVKRTKSFSINKYGEELAEHLAREYRLHQINLLNLLGAGYTERHGK